MEKIYNVLADSATFSYNTTNVDVPIISAPSANALRVEFPYTQGDKLKLRALFKPNAITSDCMFGFVCDSGDYYITQTASATTTYHYGGKSANVPNLRTTATTMSTIELDNNSYYNNALRGAIQSGYTEPIISVNSSGKATLNINGVDINYFEIFNQDERLVFGGYVRANGIMEFFKQPTIGGEVVKDGEMQIPSSVFKSINQTKEWSNFKELDFGGLTLTMYRIGNNYRLEKIKNATFEGVGAFFIRYCNNLKSFENCNFNMSGNVSSTFMRLNKLTDFNAEFPNVNGFFSSVFLGCNGLENANITLPKATASTSIFAYCTNLKHATINAPSSISASSTFQGCSSLTDIDINLPNVTNASSMFNGCSSLKSFNVNLPNVTNTSNMFLGCSSLTDVNIDLSNVTNASSMFSGCSSLKSFSADMPNVTSDYNMFKDCSGLTDIYLNAPKATSIPIGGNCNNLTSVTLNLPSCNSSISFTSTTNYPNLKIVNETTNWSGTASDTLSNMIGKQIEEATLCFNNATYLNKVCSGASALTRLSLTCPNLTLPTSKSNNPLYNCPSLQHVEITTKSANSGWTMDNVSYGTTPILPYRYVAEVPQEPNLVKVVFTSAKKMGFKGYQIQYGVGANRFSAITQTIDGLELYWSEDWDGSDLTPQANNVEIILGTLAEMNDNNKPITLTNDSNFDIVVHFNYYSAEGISVPSKSSKVVTATIGQDAQSPSRFNGGYGVLSVSE